MTSSRAAATPPPSSIGSDFDETVWTDLEQQQFHVYWTSKVLAERAAWDFARKHGSELVTILPGAIFEPVLNRREEGSVEVIARMLGGMPGTPRVGLNIVDGNSRRSPRVHGFDDFGVVDALQVHPRLLCRADAGSRRAARLRGRVGRRARVAVGGVRVSQLVRVEAVPAARLPTRFGSDRSGGSGRLAASEDLKE
jgi:hypothetical protein